MKNPTGQTRNWMMAAAAGIVMAFSANAQNVSVDRPADLDRVHAMARTANTAASHAAVAKQYRLHADALDAKAAEHEKDAREFTRASGAIVHKWPGMASGQLQTAKTNAMEARRAARETRALADHHIRLAVEAQAESNNPAVAGN